MHPERIELSTPCLSDKCAATAPRVLMGLDGVEPSATRSSVERTPAVLQSPHPR